MLRAMTLASCYRHCTRWFSADVIRSNITFEDLSGITQDEIDRTLHFLEDAGFLKVRHSPLGATLQYRITSEGMLLIEREYPAYATKPSRGMSG